MQFKTCPVILCLPNLAFNWYDLRYEYESLLTNPKPCKIDTERRMFGKFDRYRLVVDTVIWQCWHTHCNLIPVTQKVTLIWWEQMFRTQHRWSRFSLGNRNSSFHVQQSYVICCYSVPTLQSITLKVIHLRWLLKLERNNVHFFNNYKRDLTIINGTPLDHRNYN